MTLVVGIGSPHGDDQAGWRVVDRVAARLAGSHVVARRAATPLDLLDWLDGVERLVVCDACRAGGLVGQVHCWSWPTGDLAAASWSGTHSVALADVLRLAERLGVLPGRVGLWGIEIAGAPPPDSRLTEEVAAAADRVAEWIVAEVSLR